MLRLPLASENGAFFAFGASAFAGQSALTPSRCRSQKAREKELIACGWVG